jgi:L-ascorbate metabolism protein UlaG (beta-lactamase superfamily)
MQLLWYGQSCFKIESRGVTIAIDPFAKDIGLTPPRFKSDILLITHRHFDHANAAAIAGDPFLIDGPGEYEIKGVSIIGFSTFHDNAAGAERGLNTAFIIESEDLRICHLGDFGEDKLREETEEAIGDVDILLIPVGGKYTIDGKIAANIVHTIEPRIVIPMHYKIPGLTIALAPPEPFLREMGIKNIEADEKLVVKKNDLPQEETRVVLLKPA